MNFSCGNEISTYIYDEIPILVINCYKKYIKHYSDEITNIQVLYIMSVDCNGAKIFPQVNISSATKTKYYRKNKEIEECSISHKTNETISHIIHNISPDAYKYLKYNNIYRFKYNNNIITINSKSYIGKQIKELCTIINDKDYLGCNSIYVYFITKINNGNAETRIRLKLNYDNHSKYFEKDAINNSGNILNNELISTFYYVIEPIAYEYLKNC